MPLLFFESYSKYYYSSYYSLSTCVCAAMAITAFLLPLFAAFVSGEFWTTIFTSHEQPLVYFNDQFILHVLQNEEDYFYSSIFKLNDYYDNILTSPVIKIEKVDYNKDDRIDFIKLKIAFPSTPSAISNVKLMIFFNYALTKSVKLLMQSICVIDIDTSYGASYIYTNGILTLSQKSPISSGTITKMIYYDDIFQNTTSPYDYTSLYKEFSSRNLTTPYEYDKLVMPFRKQAETEIEVDITIPSYQEVMYIAPLLNTLKKAWVQYISIFIPIAVVINFILLFIYKYQIFSAAVVDDLPKNRK